MPIMHFGEESELLEEKELICLNDGRGTKMDVHTGKKVGIRLDTGI